jgi:hypothetical protein
MASCISVCQTDYFRATILPRYGTGLSLKSVCFRAASLILYRTPESMLTPNEDQHSTTTYPELPKDTWVLPPWRRSYTRRTEVDCQGIPGR